MLTSQPPVDKNLRICYNCASEEYYLSQYSGNIQVHCINPDVRTRYNPDKREICCCPHFRRRKPDLIQSIIPED